MTAIATIAPADSQHTDSAGLQPATASDHRQPITNVHGEDRSQSSCGGDSERQYMRALERANEVRIARAELKRKVAAGTVDVAQIVVNCPWEAESMAVADLLTSQRRWGHTRCRKLLARVPISERKTLGSMTERQRSTLVALLADAGACDSSRFVGASVTSPRLTSSPEPALA